MLAVAAGVLALLLGGGAVGASPASPTPAAASEPTTTPAVSIPPLRVALPGLLTVSVDLPKVQVDLGGQRATSDDAASAATPAPSPTVHASAASSVPPAQRRAPAAVRRNDPTPAPSKQSTPRRATTVGDRDVRQPVTRPARTDRKAPAATPRSVADAFQGMLHTGLPVWLLAGIVSLCGLGTVIVVRSAGRRPTGMHRRTG